MQLLREQIFELQNAVIEKLSLFADEAPIKTKKESDILLPGVVEDWLPGREDQ